MDVFTGGGQTSVHAEVICQKSQFLHWDYDLLSKAPSIFITISIDQEVEETTLCKTGSKDKSFDLPPTTPTSVLLRDCFQVRQSVFIPKQSHLIPSLGSWDISEWE